MALPSTTVISGMQNTGPTSITGGTSLSTMTIRLFADFQKYLDPTETPFTSSLKTGKAVDAKKVEWGSSFLAPNTSATGASIADGSTTSVTVATGDGAKFMISDVLKIENEFLWVTAITGDVLTVRRGIAGTTAAAHTTVGTVIDILGPAAQENVASPLTPVAKGALEYNVPQLMDYAIGLSERENNTPDYEFRSGTKYEAYLQKVMKEAAINFERFAVLGKRREEVAMTGATSTPSMFGGLDYFTDDAIDLSGAAISETALGDALQRLWTRVGPENMAKDLLVGPFVKRALSSLWNTNRIADVKDTTTTLVWKSVETDFGTIRFVLSRYIPAGSAYLVNLNDITIHPYKNGAWKEVKLPTDGPSIKGRFTGDYTMVFRNNAARLKMVNIGTNPALYPNL